MRAILKQHIRGWGQAPHLHSVVLMLYRADGRYVVAVSERTWTPDNAPVYVTRFYIPDPDPSCESRNVAHQWYDHAVHTEREQISYASRCHCVQCEQLGGDCMYAPSYDEYLEERQGYGDEQCPCAHYVGQSERRCVLKRGHPVPCEDSEGGQFNFDTEDHGPPAVTPPCTRCGDPWGECAPGRCPNDGNPWHVDEPESERRLRHYTEPLEPGLGYHYPAGTTAADIDGPYVTPAQEAHAEREQRRIEAQAERDLCDHDDDLPF
jgi:hypothetical protein